MLEAGCVVLENHRPLYHEPRYSSVEIPDSDELWDLLWNNRHHLLGWAHSHPGSGFPWPSSTDIIHFDSLELGLGKRLKFWITSATHVILVTWAGPERYDYQIELEIENLPWLDHLKKISGYYLPEFSIPLE